MRRVQRSGLSKETIGRLQSLQAKVNSDKDPTDRAGRLWDAKDKSKVGRAHTKNNRTGVLRLIDEAKRLSFQAVVHRFVRDAMQPKPALVTPVLANVIQATQGDWAWAR